MLPRGSSSYTFYQNTSSLFKILTKWLLPSSSLFFVVLISITLFVSIIIALLSFWYKPYNQIKLGLSFYVFFGQGSIYTSHPDALYILAGIPAKMGPNRKEDKSLSAFKKHIALNQTSYLVWFNPPCREYLYRPIEFASIIDMEEIRNFPDGKIYILKGAKK